MNSRVDTVCVLLACLSLVILLVVVRVVLRARASRAFLSLLTHSLVFLSFSLYHFFALLVVAFVSFIVNSHIDTICILLACLSLVIVISPSMPSSYLSTISCRRRLSLLVDKRVVFTVKTNIGAEIYCAAEIRELLEWVFLDSIVAAMGFGGICGRMYY